MNRDTIPGKIPEPIWRRRRNESVPKLWSKRGTLLPEREFSSRRRPVWEQPSGKSKQLPWQRPIPNPATTAITIPKQQQQQQSIPRAEWVQPIPKRSRRIPGRSVPWCSWAGEQSFLFFTFPLTAGSRLFDMPHVQCLTYGKAELQDFKYFTQSKSKLFMQIHNVCIVLQLKLSQIIVIIVIIMMVITCSTHVVR